MDKKQAPKKQTPKIKELDYKKVFEATIGGHGELLTIVYKDELPELIRYENKDWQVISRMAWLHRRGGDSYRYELKLKV